MLWVIPLGLGAAYMLFGRKKAEETSSEEEAVDTSSFPADAPMSQTMTATQARAMGFAAPTQAPMPAKTPAYVQIAARNARVQKGMLMKASIGPGKPAPNPNVEAAKRLQASLEAASHPFGWKNTPGTNPADDIVSSGSLGGSFDLSTKLK